MKLPKIAIIVLNWKQPDLTLTTIASLKKIKHPNFSYKIILVDNASSDNSWDIFVKNYSKDKSISLLRTSSNLGFVGGNNFGIESVKKNKYDYYLVINNDVEVDPNFLEKMVNQVQSDKSIGLLAPKIYFAPGFEYQKDRYSKNDIGKVIWFAGGKIDWQNIYCSHFGIDEVDKGQYEKVYQPDYLTGCCLLISSDLVNKVGIFDPKYYLYMEDADLSVRAQRYGFKTLYLPTAKIWHLNSGSSGAGSNLHDYFITRNRLLFGFQYASLRTKLALFKQSIIMLFTSPSSWQKRGILDYYLGIFGKGSWK